MTELDFKAIGQQVKPSSTPPKEQLVVACIPAYNTEGQIAKVILNAQKYVDRVIVCNDGSSDMTGIIAERMGATVVMHNRNLGYGAALSSLFQAARHMGADFVVTLDSDGQHNPKYVPRLLEPLLDGKADIVIGSRFLSAEGKKNIPEYRQNGIKIINGLTATGSLGGLTDSQSGMRAYNRRAIEAINPTENGMGASTEILLQAKSSDFIVSEVPIVVNYDKNSSTKHPLSQGLDVTLSTVKHLSINRPLLFFGAPGVIFFLVGLAFWIWALSEFSVSRYFSANIVLSGLCFTTFGLLFMITAVILWVMVSLIREERYFT